MYSNKMSRSFLVDSLIDKDSHTKPKSMPQVSQVNLMPPFFGSPRYPYQHPTITDYLLTMGRLPFSMDNKKSGSENSSRICGADPVKLQETNLHSSNFFLNNFYPKETYQPFCCSVSQTPHPHLPPSKNKVFRPVPLSSKKKLEDIKTGENLSPQAEGIKISLKGNFI